MYLKDGEGGKESKIAQYIPLYLFAEKEEEDYKGWLAGQKDNMRHMLAYFSYFCCLPFPPSSKLISSDL